MSDGYRFTLGIWEKPTGAIVWEVPRRDVLTVFREAMDDYDVVRAYCDPHEWRSDINALAEEYGDRVVGYPTSVDTRMAESLDMLHTDLKNGVTFHDGDKRVREHYGNAYVRRKGGRVLIRKETPNSNRKIDAVVGDALAYRARSDALLEGWTHTPKTEDRKVIHFTH